MAYNFNIRKILQEAAEKEGKISDQTVANFDTILANSDLEKIFDKSCPITGDVCAKLQEAAADPMNLTIAPGDGNYYLDYNALVNYMEAAGYSDPKLALNSIFEAYSDQAPDMSKDNFIIVFPSKDTLQEAANAVGRQSSGLGYTDIAWTSHFLQDLVNQGVKTTHFIDPGLPRKGTLDADNDFDPDKLKAKGPIEGGLPSVND